MNATKASSEKGSAEKKGKSSKQTAFTEPCDELSEEEDYESTQRVLAAVGEYGNATVASPVSFDVEDEKHEMELSPPPYESPGAHVRDLGSAPPYESPHPSEAYDPFATSASDNMFLDPVWNGD